MDQGGKIYKEKIQSAMKKIIYLIFTLLTIFSLSGCLSGDLYKEINKNNYHNIINQKTTRVL